jgi:serine/threonine-protein kinase
MVTSAALTIALAMTGTALWRSTRPVQHPLVRLSVDLGPQAIEGLNSRVAISPDGQRIVFAARGLDGKQQLASRLLDQAESELLPGTQDGSDPFFSPDGQWIGFFSSSQLKKVPVRGGAPIILSAAPQLFGASWGEDGNIVAALSQVGPLSVVPAVGGVPKLITKLPADETNHRWPQILPRAQAVLFTASPTITLQENAKIETVSLKTGKVTVLERSGYHGRYVPTGHLVYVHQGVLFGIRFDPAKPEVRGIPTPIVEDLAADPVSGSGQFDFSGAASGTGTLVYLAGKRSIQTPRVSWLDSAGNAQPLISAPGEYSQPRLSPDGGQLAFMSGGDIYIYESERGTKTRLTFTGNANYPIWSPDGKHIAFRRDIEVWWIRSDGAGNPLKLLTNQSVPVPSSFTPDGRWLAYHDQDSATGQDLWTLPLDLSNPESPNAGKPQSFLRSGANELLPRFSPDGRWIAYRSDESGANEIYVRPFPAASAGKWQISNGGGLYAFWSKNGHELFYESSDNRIMVVNYTVASGSFVPGRPRLWLDQRLFTLGTSNLDLAPDGKRFAVLTAPEAAGEKTSVHVTMLLNFFDEIRRRVPVK